MRLALNGGEPIRKTLLPYGRQTVSDDDICAIEQVLRSDWLTTGPKVEEFEEVFAAYVGAKYAVAFSSGTAGLHAAVFAAGLGASDEAITTPLTFAATANCLLYQNAKPVFADVEPGTLNIAPEQITRCLNPRVKAILPVDYAGHPAELDEIRQIAERNGLVIIEDAAHALGATYKGRRIGTLSTMTVFSTHPVKHITTGEGGVVTTQDARLMELLRLFRNHGIRGNARERQEQGKWFYEMVALGYNYRVTDIQCALGITQLQKLDGWLGRRRAIASSYSHALEQIPEVEVPVQQPHCASAWHLYVIRLNLERFRVDRSQVFHALRAENIGVTVHYIPVPWHPYYEQLGYRKGQWPVAESAYERILTLPLFPRMTDSDVEDVIRGLQKVVDAFRA
jgi:perosamine synthetase